MSTLQVRKRIVLFHRTGPFAELARIAGILEGTPKQVATAMEPAFTYREANTEKRMEHWKTLPHAVWYREWALKAAGRLNDFNPAQR